MESIQSLLQNIHLILQVARLDQYKVKNQQIEILRKQFRSQTVADLQLNKLAINKTKPDPHSLMGQLPILKELNAKLGSKDSFSQFKCDPRWQLCVLDPTQSHTLHEFFVYKASSFQIEDDYFYPRNLSFKNLLKPPTIRRINSAVFLDNVNVNDIDISEADTSNIVMND